ncbi:S1 family peptidase [Pseudoalteromonas denitrificans]|uniref:Trypsin-like peptidase domain-containing protein n=1 Tax=Pseudoalteromonas denitrificans DSM 6059 TaxID=1123010 RepID=A0A1I1MU04_9GAMM|nr:serine protease [Pseudoalteromonas denitrificans]SFC88392.1 Trypsin-like peptidase domain-containing protein [Pseudoalteromonas denitrificans DSM 6059]
MMSSVRVNAEFDPEVLSQSTVRILIKGKQGITGAATGFLWQTNTQIVTSLHVLSNDPNSKIIVEFGRLKRKAIVKAVLPSADLVLLEVKKPIAGWQPLLTFKEVKPKYKAEVSALGFNRGSIGMSTRELRKGFVTPEMLQVLLPPDAVKNIIRTSQLNIKLPIYYLDGSLLPGYSGSPIVNIQGELIGIGNGGLENGASSVSWVIPAANLNTLVKSKTSQLPKYQNELNEIFSVDKLSPEKGNTASLQSTPFDSNLSFLGSLFTNLFNHAFAKQNTEMPNKGDYLSPLTEVNYHQFNFIKVKSRTYEQLLTSSGTPTNMKHVFTLFNHVFHGYKVNYNKYVFDIYEDGRFGLNVVVPQGVELVVDQDEFLVAQGNMFCRICDYGIQYHARQLTHDAQQLIRKSPESFLNTVANQQWLDLNEEGDYGEYSDFRTIESFGGQRYVLRAAYSDFSEPFKNQFELNYLTAATNRDAWFQAQGILNRFDNNFFSSLNKYRGTDCTANNLPLTQATVCSDIETMFTVIISVHLTSFSNMFFPLR